MSRTINLSSAELRAQVSTAQRLYAASKDPALVQPATFVSTGYYVPPAWQVRDGGNDHFEHASLGLGAQIQPRGQA